MRKAAALAVVLGCLCVFAYSASAQEKKAPASKGAAAAKKPMHVIMNEADVKWGDAPPNLPAGAKMAVLQGDPGKAGMYTIRLKAPDGYKVAAHWRRFRCRGWVRSRSSTSTRRTIRPKPRSKSLGTDAQSKG